MEEKTNGQIIKGMHQFFLTFSKIVESFFSLIRHVQLAFSFLIYFKSILKKYLRFKISTSTDVIFSVNFEHFVNEMKEFINVNMKN